MAEPIKHLRGFGNTLCGITEKFSCNTLYFPTYAKSYAEVTCERCMKTESYRAYLAGKFREKPTGNKNEQRTKTGN